MMKYMNFIKLLSVLLCVVMLLASCKGKDPDGESTDTDSGVETTVEKVGKDRTPVEAKPENYFSMIEEPEWLSLSTATRMEGECIDATPDKHILVFRKADIDHQNTVTETFTVYNTETETVVLTVNNYFENGKFDLFDWNNLYPTDEDLNYPTSVKDVSVLMVDMIPILVVKHATVTELEIDPDADEDLNPNSHRIATTYEYYDANGVKIVETGYDADVYANGAYVSESVGCVTVGDVNAFFDLETAELISVVNADNEKFYVSYDVENNLYGYVSGVQSGALGMNNEYLEIYRKSDSKRILRYYPEYADFTEWYVLENGNVLFQLVKILPIDSTREGDIEMGPMKMLVDTYVLDILTGQETPVELDFVVDALYANNEWTEAQDADLMGVQISDNAVNVASITYIKDKNLQNPQLAILNNDLSVMYSPNLLVPEHKVDLMSNIGIGFEVIADNHYLVDLHNVVTPKAIVTKEGAVRTYLNAGDRVVANFVVNEKGIFNYDMTCLYRFETYECEFLSVLGERVIVKKIVTPTLGDGTLGIPETRYYVLDCDGTTVTTTRILNGASIVAYTGSYIVAKNDSNEKYVLYNVKLEHLLTTENPMEIWSFEDEYLVGTALPNVNGDLVDVYYTVK